VAKEQIITKTKFSDIFEATSNGAVKDVNYFLEEKGAKPNESSCYTNTAIYGAPEALGSKRFGVVAPSTTILNRLFRKC